MKKLSKILSVGLSLTLCASLVAPSFAAATFADLQGVIDNKTSYTYEKDGETVTGISYDTATDTVKLHEEVRYESGNPETIVINSGKNVILDLNGNNINGQGKSSSVITVNQGAELTLKDSTARVETDKDGNETYVSGAITGGRDVNWNGGGVDNAGKFTMKSGAISNNYAKYGGGVTNQSTGTFILDGGVISDNSTSKGGGVRNVGNFTMNGGVIDGNKSSEIGGGVYNEGTFTMNSGVIDGNESSGHSGGVYNGDTGTFIMTGGSIANNAANVGYTSTTQGYSGGGVYNYRGRFEMSGGVIEGNSAFRGGGIRNDGTVTVSGSAVIRDNTTSNSGGGIDSIGALIMTGGTVAGNTSGTSGGGIAAKGTVALSSVTVENNVAAKSCGGLMISSASATLEDVTLTGNSAGTAAGAVGISTGSTAALTNVTITENQAGTNGGAISIADSSATLKGTTITGNTAGTVGGGIRTSGSTDLDISSDTTIAGNKADQAGDEIYAKKGATLSLPKDLLWDQDNESDREDGVENVYGAKGLESISDDVGLKHHQHKYVEKVTTEPTCEGTGEKTRTCQWEICSYEKTEPIDALRHDMGEWEVTTPATCEEDGVKTRTCQREGCSYEETEPIDALGHDMGEWYVSKEPGPGVAGEERCDCRREGCDYAETRPIDPLPVPAPVTGNNTVEIDDVDVPLSGLFTRADAIGYLWEQSGSPEWELSDFPDVPEDHYWAVAIGWAEDMGIALADEDGNFRPDDLVLRSTEDVEGEFQEFLNRYAVYAGIKLDADELFYELGGAADDIVMGEEAQAIFDDFFAKLEAALAQAA